MQKRTLRDILCDNTGIVHTYKITALKRLERVCAQNSSSLTDMFHYAASVFQSPSIENPLLNCSDVKTPLEAKDLCLFGASNKAKDLKSPGRTSKTGN